MFAKIESGSPYRRLWLVLIALLCFFISCSDEQKEATVNPANDLGPGAVVTDLRVTATAPDRISISWKAPATNGEDLVYQIRHAGDSLTEANWYEGVVCLYEPPVADSGVTQSYDVTGLPGGKNSYIAIRIRDNAGRFGPISANISGVLPALLFAPVSYDLSGSAIVASDFDSDGDTDLVITKPVESGDNVFTMMNDGTGRFTQNQVLSVNGSLTQVRSVDFNADGFNDIAALSTTSVLILTNDGAGNFTFTNTRYIDLDTDGMQAADFDGDGFPDIIAAGHYYGGKFGTSSSLLTISFNDGAGGFADNDTVDAFYLGGDEICILDADNDGDIDVASGYSSNPTILLRYNDGTGRNWDDHLSVGVKIAVPGLAAGDLDNDGWQDFAVATTYDDQIVVATGSEGGSYGLKVSTPGAGVGSDIHLGDFDGDGFLDIVRTGTALTLHLNDGEGGFTGAATYVAGEDLAQSALAIADFDRDGHPDIAIVRSTGKMLVLMSSL